MEDLRALKERREEVARSLESRIEQITVSLEKTLEDIETREEELKTLRTTARDLRQQAQTLFEGTAHLSFGKPLRRTGKTGRTRTEIRGRAILTDTLRPTVSHRFVDTGEVVIGHLNKRKANSLHGKEWRGTTAELVDALYEVDGDVGFYTYTSERGVKLNPLVVFLEKAKGRIGDQILVPA